MTKAIELSKRPPQTSSNPRKTHTISMLSWNIDGIRTKFGSKLAEPEFAKILNSSLIFCLQEAGEPIKTENFKCFNSVRKRAGFVSEYIIQFPKALPTTNTQHLPILKQSHLKKTFLDLKKTS